MGLRACRPLKLVAACRIQNPTEIQKVNKPFWGVRVLSPSGIYRASSGLTSYRV